MHRVIDIDLVGQPRPFRLHEDAYDALRAYLDQARSRLGDDPDAGEVIDDLERSIGERLAGRVGSADRVLAAADIAAVLDEVGAVETGRGASSSTPATAASPAYWSSLERELEHRRQAAAGYRPRRRRLYRIREGQSIAGVCTGLAAYADLRVDWVRAIFVLGALFTAGAFILVYLVLMFLLPVVATRADWIAAMEQADAPGA